MGADIHVTGNQGNAMQVAVKENRHEILDLLNSDPELLERTASANGAPVDSEQAAIIRNCSNASKGKRHDKYGFVIEAEYEEKYLNFEKKYVKLLEHRRKAWDKYLRGVDLTKKIIENAPDLRELIRKGIPRDLRGEIWYKLVATKLESSISDSYYENLLATETFPAQKEIEKDVHRTFPGHSFFATESGKKSLRNVLLAYSIRNPSIGYCQSMNFLVGLLLLNMREEHAFVVLRYIVEDLLEDYYVNSMTGLSVDQKILESLIQKDAPKIYQKLDEEHFPVTVFTTRWLMCIFLNTLPTETTMRIWDCLLFEGPSVLLLVSFTLLKMNENALINAPSIQELMRLFEVMTTSLFDADALLEEMFKYSHLVDESELELKRFQFWKIIDKERDHKREQVMYLQQERTYYSALRTMDTEDDVSEDE